MFVLDTNATLFSVGAVLSEVQVGEEKVIATQARHYVQVDSGTARHSESCVRSGHFRETFPTLPLGEEVSYPNGP